MEYLLVIIFAVAVAAVALHAFKPEWFAPVIEFVNNLTTRKRSNATNRKSGQTGNI